MGRSQSRVIGEVMAPVALFSGIALSPESRFRYGRYHRKAVISFRSPSLVLLGVGSTPPPSSPTVSSGGHVTANRQFVAVLRHRLLRASVSHNQLVCSDMAACITGGLLVGYSCSRLSPLGVMHPSGFALSGGPTDFSLGCHTLAKCWLSLHISRWGLRFALRPAYMALPLRNSSVVLTYGFVLLAPVPLPCLGTMGCALGLRVGCLQVWYITFSVLDWA